MAAEAGGGCGGSGDCGGDGGGGDGPEVEASKTPPR